MTSTPYTNSGQAFAAAFGSLETAVEQFLDGDVGREQLTITLMDSRGIINDFESANEQ